MNYFAAGVDFSAREYALKNGIRIKEFLPEYKKYGKAAPLKRNLQIIEYSDEIFAFWDGKSWGTAFVCYKEQQENGEKAVGIYDMNKINIHPHSGWIFISCTRKLK